MAGHVGFRTSESVIEPPNWICVTISPEGGASPAAETLRAPAAWTFIWETWRPDWLAGRQDSNLPTPARMGAVCGENSVRVGYVQLLSPPNTRGSA